MNILRDGNYVSIIMPTYNAEKYIQESINSVINQTYTNWELIIINDGSTDKTLEIIKENQLIDSRIKLINQINKKQAAARNAGFKIAKGDWIAIIDSDDLWMPDKLEIQLYNSGRSDVIYTGGIINYQLTGLKSTYKTIFGLYEGLDMYKELYNFNPIPNLSVLFKRDLIKKVGYQNENIELWGCEDWDYWIRMAKCGATFLGFNRSLFFYRIHNEGTSFNKCRMVLAEFCALFQNTDFKYLNRNFVYKRLSSLIENNIFYFIDAGDNDNLIKMIKDIQEVKYSLKFKSLYIIMKLSKKPSKSIIHFFLRGCNKFSIK